MVTTIGIACMYLLGVGLCVAAWWDRRRIQDDKDVIKEWYVLVCQAMRESEKSASAATAACCRATAAAKLAEEKLKAGGFSSNGVTIYR